jgi:phenylalanyl-tRNA synthetase beta chain
MKVSYNWLQTYLDFTYSAEELSDILTQTGLEVESIETFEQIRGGLKGVVVGEVLTCEQHPDADKLKVTTVHIGSATPLQIVCGAPNVATGQKVLVATVGTTLYPQPDQAFDIKKAKIRGVASEGMLCAEDELGLGQSHDGILVLPPETAVGTAASDYFKLEKDIQLEIGLTPNRSDAMGHIGVARDIRAFHNLTQAQKLDIKFPALEQLHNAEFPELSVQVTDKNACKRYLAIELDQVKVVASPVWLQNRLKAVGLQPINNVVDISNFVQLELGTPLHIFDAQQSGTSIEVRCAEANENFTGLDKHNYKLAGHELVIANQKSVLCLAGILGGLESSVTKQTTQLLIESALFDAVRIRKAARQHGLNTDASFRFERGVDPELTHSALLRCVGLLQELTGAQIKSATYQFNGDTPKPISLHLNKHEVTKIIGNDLPNAQIEQILTDLDFKINAFSDSTWDLTVPSYRTDVTRPIDVIEEILRIYGLNNITLPEKWNFSLSPKLSAASDLEKETCAEFLVGRAYLEVMNNSLTKKQYHAYLDESFGQAIGLLNPLSQDLAHLRQNLVFGLLENIAYNQNRQQANLQLFEFGQDYQRVDEKHIETQRLALALIGKKEAENWNNNSPQEFNFFDLKKEVVAILERFGLAHDSKEVANSNPVFEQGYAIHLNGKILVELGKVHPKIQQDFAIKQAVFYAQFNWLLLTKEARKRKIGFQELPKSFAVRRDLSLLIDQQTSYQDLASSAMRAETKLLQDVQLFDVYEGKNIPEGKKSYALAFYLQDGQHTLGEAQIEKAMKRIMNALEKDCAAQLRN